MWEGRGRGGYLCLCSEGLHYGSYFIKPFISPDSYFTVWPTILSIFGWWPLPSTIFICGLRDGRYLFVLNASGLLFYQNSGGYNWLTETVLKIGLIIWPGYTLTINDCFSKSRGETLQGYLFSQSISEPISQSIDRLIDQSSNQLIDRSISQSINQSIS